MEILEVQISKKTNVLNFFIDFDWNPIIITLGSIDETDSETEVVYLDLSSPTKKKSKIRSKTEKVSKRIFALFNQKGLNSSMIMRHLKSEIKTPSQMTKLLKLKDIENNNWTVLHYSANLGYVSVFSYILTNYSNVDINRLTKNGKTALHLAIEMLHVNMIKFLIHHGASLHSRDDKGKSPLDLLSDYNLHFLIEFTKSEKAMSTFPSSSSSAEDKLPKVNIKNIQIHEVKEENVETMFRKIRDYFDEKWFLQPKGSSQSSLIEPPSSVGDSFIYSEATEEWNLNESDSQIKFISEDENKMEAIKSPYSIKSSSSKRKSKKIDIKAVSKDHSNQFSGKIGPKSFNASRNI